MICAYSLPCVWSGQQLTAERDNVRSAVWVAHYTGLKRDRICQLGKYHPTNGLQSMYDLARPIRVMIWEYFLLYAHVPTILMTYIGSHTSTVYCANRCLSGAHYDHVRCLFPGINIQNKRNSYPLWYHSSMCYPHDDMKYQTNIVSSRTFLLVSEAAEDWLPTCAREWCHKGLSQACWNWLLDLSRSR